MVCSVKFTYWKPTDIATFFFRKLAGGKNVKMKTIISSNSYNITWLKR